MKQIRLLIVIDGFFIGGTETQILSTIPYLIQSGIHVVVVGRDGPLSSEFINAGCTVRYLNFPLDESVHAYYWRDLESELSNIIATEQINLIHSHQLTSARFTSQLVKQFNLPMFFSVHGTYYNLSALQVVLRNQAKVISVSPAIHEWLLNNHVDSTMLPNGISTEKYRPMDKSEMRRTFNLAEDPPAILYAGRLAWEKADICIRLIEACVHLKREYFHDIKLIVAGSGNGAAIVQKYAASVQKAEQADFITFLGDQMDMTRVYALGDCVVGTGRVALEAMACGRPVVAAGSKGMFGLVTPTNFDLALHYHFGDHNADRPITETALAVPLAAVLGSSEIQQSLGSNGRGFVETRFNIQNIAQELIKMYHEAVR